MKKTVVSIQTRGNPGKVDENLKKAGMIMKRIPFDYDLIIFPELFGTGYTWNPSTKSVIQKEQETIENWLKEISKMQNCAVISGLGRKEGDDFFNATISIENGEIIHYYDKVLLFRGEKEIFKPGSSFDCVDLSGIRVGVFMCYEIGSPEIARIMALKGAQLFAVPFAFGRTRFRNYDTLTKARAIENGCFLMTSSTPGEHENLKFYGHSRIIHPSGTIMGDALDKEGWTAAEIEIKDVDYFRYHEDEQSSGYWKNMEWALFHQFGGLWKKE